MNKIILKQASTWSDLISTHDANPRMKTVKYNDDMVSFCTLYIDRITYNIHFEIEYKHFVDSRFYLSA
jgi:hypothetical protein